MSHFATAVRLGYTKNAAVRVVLYKAAAIGHERVGDEYGAARQTARGMLAVTKFRFFDAAVDAASRGDLDTVKAMSARVVDVPETPGEWNQGWYRKGNSQQDLRLTAYGWALGEVIRTGKIQTRAEVSAWIGSNIAAPSPSGPNSPDR